MYIPMSKQTWIYTVWRSFNKNFNFSGWFSRGRFFKIFSIYSYVKIISPIVAPPFSRGSWFEQTWIYNFWRCSNMNVNFSSQMVFQRKFSKDFQYIFLCKNLSYNCGPTLLPGIKIWIYTTWGSFLLSYNFIDQMIFEKIF